MSAPPEASTPPSAEATPSTGAAAFPPGTWCVYFLRLRDGALYCGCTNDLARRLETHAAGRGSRVVRTRLPFRLAYVEAVPAGTRSAAQAREAALKRMTKAQKEAVVSAST